MRIFPVLLLLAWASAPVAAESFDYDGKAIIDCLCPEPATASCAIKAYKDHNYSVEISVHRTLTIELADVCYNRRDRDICCDEPRSHYRGTVGARRPN